MKKCSKTVTINNVRLDVVFDVQAPEQAAPHHPGCGLEIDLCHVYAGGQDVLELLSEDAIDTIIHEIIEGE